MDSLNLWLILILGGLGTYLLRLSFILIFQHVQLP
ncbi:MAG: AzlD domain-containing protein, partial [Chloroflexi bacterium]|nr:AzlD domain-containing protein [Chloroflexota bacterium]